jgi:hypothetical protein
MTTTLDGVRGQRHAPAAFYPQERPGTHCIGVWVGPRAGLDRGGKSRTPTGFDHRTAQPVASRYTDRATGPTIDKEEEQYYRKSLSKPQPRYSQNLVTPIMTLKRSDRIAECCTVTSPVSSQGWDKETCLLTIHTGLKAGTLPVSGVTRGVSGGSNPFPEIPKFWKSWAEFPVPWKIQP